MLPSNREYIAFGSVDFETATQAILNVIVQIDADVNAVVIDANKLHSHGLDTIADVEINKAWATSTWNHLIARLKPVIGSDAIRLVNQLAA